MSLSTDYTFLPNDVINIWITSRNPDGTFNIIIEINGRIPIVIYNVSQADLQELELSSGIKAVDITPEQKIIFKNKYGPSFKI